ncbi:MAG TPA: penicillin acylase family protein, partial [Thermoanaerobaculia bacterium]|nr:penicillin acylase family protein [Thermoanaerobaculia bacterium]
MADPLPIARPEPEPRPRKRRLRIVLAVLAVLVVLVVLSAALWTRHQLRASLPQLDGERSLPGLSAEVTVERDGLGVPTIRAANRLDAARALGFLHGQERFFQMDLLRRKAAGELSELFGAVALEVDREIRVHRLRDVARRTMASAPPRDRAILEAYAAGVNAGLSALGASPFEYLLIPQRPAPWKAEDSMLVPLAMFIELHNPNGRRELSLGVMHDLLPPQLAE